MLSYRLYDREGEMLGCSTLYPYYVKRIMSIKTSRHMQAAKLYSISMNSTCPTSMIILLCNYSVDCCCGLYAASGH